MPEVVVSSQMYPGVGFDQATGRAHRVAIEYDAPQSVTTGQNVALQLVSITSSRDLAEKLNVDASASYQAATFGVSGELSLASSKEVNSYYTYTLINVVVSNQATVIRNPRLTQEANSVLTQQGWDAFVRLYGPQFVEGFITGGAYYGLIECETTSKSDQDNVKLKLSGHYGPFGTSVEIEQALKDIQKNTQINVWVVESGGSGQVIATDLDGMLKTAREFPAVAKANPVPIRALTSDYRDTVKLPQEGSNSLARTQQKNTLEDLGRAYMQLRDYKADVQFVLAHLTDFDEFRNLTAPELTQKEQLYQAALVATGKEIDRVVRLGTSCAADYNQCQTYVPGIQFEKLPEIQGRSLVLQQIEDKLAVLETHLTGDQGGSLELGGTSGSPGGGMPYIDFHFGDHAQDYNTRIVNDQNATLSVLANTLLVKDEVGGSSSQLRVQGDLTVDGTIQMSGKTLDQWLADSLTALSH